jgi:hypothetical protein
MTSEATQTHRSVAVLKLPNKVSGLAAISQQMVTSMTGNAAFPSPVPALATVTSAISDFQTAEAAALARTKGAAATRNAKRKALVQLLEQLKTYVQTVADASVSDGEGIIQSAGMAVRKTAVRAPRVFNAVQGDVTGSVKLVAASAGHRAAYNWQYSIDGGKTWVAMPGTLQAKTTVAGLTAGTTVEFRYQALTKTGEGNCRARDRRPPLVPRRRRRPGRATGIGSR